MSSKVIAITGQSGSGKTTVSTYFRSLKYRVIDCDNIVKDVHKNPKCQDALVAEYGEGILIDGKIDKVSLSKVAFETKEKLQRLTDITHPFIIKQILSEIYEETKKYETLIFVDGAVIIGHEFEKYCNEFIVVTSDEEEQINRITSRDNISKEDAKIRLSKQTPYSEMIARADYIICNNSTKVKLLTQAEFILNKLLE